MLPFYKYTSVRKHLKRNWKCHIMPVMTRALKREAKQTNKQNKSDGLKNMAFPMLLKRGASQTQSE